MKLLFDQLDQRDSIAIVVYAGATGLVLDSTPGDRKKVIFDSLNRLRSGGPTNRGRGIQLAYKIAQDHYIDGGTNRVILCNDGDFNVGVAGIDQLAQLAKENAAQNIFLTVLGFGSDRPDNVILEQISGHGHGNYVFIEHEEDARQVLLKQVQTSLKTIARDVKLEVEFNPMEVESYRLIGFENLFLSGEDVFDITIDGEDIDAGHSVTALYEIVPKRRVQRADLAGDLAGDSIGGVPGQDSSPGRDRTPMENLKYQQQIVLSDQAASGEMLSVKLRYLPPAGDQNVQIEFSVKDSGKEFIRADRDFQFAASVAAFGMLLRHSPHKGNSDLDLVEMLASTGAIDDRSGYREEFLSLVKRARMIGSW